MKIIVVTNKFLNRNGIKRIDSGYYNLYIPLMNLGHNVIFYDIENPTYDNSFSDVVKKFSPDLIFCCLTGDNNSFKYEPVEEIREITKKGNIVTFNWFCDDTWRFNSFSKNFCKNFTVCSTPEFSFLEKYKKESYSNIILGLWHCNHDIASRSDIKYKTLGFCGGITADRNENIQYLRSKGNHVNIFNGCCYEEMFYNYSTNLIGLNFSVNYNDPEKKTQMKLRPMEIVNSCTLLATEYTPGLEHLFDIDNHIISFKSKEELNDKIGFYIKNPESTRNMVQGAYTTFLKNHESHVRLKNILPEIMKFASL